MASEKPQFPKFWMWLLIGTIGFEIVWIAAVALFGAATKHIEGETENFWFYAVSIALIMGAIPVTVCTLVWPFVLFCFGYRALEWRRGSYFSEGYEAQINRQAEDVVKLGRAGTAE